VSRRLFVVEEKQKQKRVFTFTFLTSSSCFQQLNSLYLGFAFFGFALPRLVVFNSASPWFFAGAVGVISSGTR
jgi:hypothetical protein